MSIGTKLWVTKKHPPGPASIVTRVTGGPISGSTPSTTPSHPGERTWWQIIHRNPTAPTSAPLTGVTKTFSLFYRLHIGPDLYKKRKNHFAIKL